MGQTIAQKIIAAHLVDGEMKPGGEIGLRIDQTLTQDATGTMAYLEFESMGIPRVKTERSVAYVDHNTLQSGFMNADDHRYIQTVAAKHGIWYSRPGNGICHQVHYERFGIPGKTLIGSDSHTPTGGGLGMLAIGAGGMDVAVAMGGGAYYIPMPKMLKVELTGGLRAGVSAKDIILEVLRQLSVKGGVGYIVEYAGPGVKSLTVPQRCTITNMGAELGATSSIFPSDEMTREFLAAQDRELDWVALESDADAEYDKVIEINLDELKPLAACPHSPDNVKPVSELGEIKVDQVCIGSCTNSSLADMLKVAAMLKGKKIADTVSLSISPGSRQVFSMLAECGALTDLIDAGARILECACGPCIGMGFSPNSAGVSLRTFNRNFLGRSGTKDGQVYLVSPETAAASALTGYITDPSAVAGTGEAQAVAGRISAQKSGTKVDGRSQSDGNSDDKSDGIKENSQYDGSDKLCNDAVCSVSAYNVPATFRINDSGVIAPLDEDAARDAEVVKGPNIKPFPDTHPLEDNIRAEVIIKLGDNITTDHIMPAGSRILPYRSNIPHLSKFCFEVVDPEFAERAVAARDGESNAGRADRFKKFNADIDSERIIHESGCGTELKNENEGCAIEEESMNVVRGGVIVGGHNYGQGSSREHAALVPLYLGIKAVIAKSFARIHAANLVNAGILPLVFENEADYDKVVQGGVIEIKDIYAGLAEDKVTAVVYSNAGADAGNVTSAGAEADGINKADAGNVIRAGVEADGINKTDAGTEAEGRFRSIEESEIAGCSGEDSTGANTDANEIVLRMEMAERQKKILLAGGLLKYTAQ